MKLTPEQDARICAEYGVTPGEWGIGRNPRMIFSGDEEIAEAAFMPCRGGYDDLAAERGMLEERADAALAKAKGDTP